MRPLKIALFSDSAFPILNGVSVSIDSLIKEFRAKGHSVFLYTSSHWMHADSDPNITRFLALETPWTKNYPLAFPPFYPWFHEFKQRTFDLVHTHTPFTIGFVGLRWAQSCEIPIVSTYHTHYDKYVHYVPFFPKRYLQYKIAKHTHYYYNEVQHVITPSQASLQWLMRHRVHTPISVIPTGVHKPPLLDRAQIRARLGVAPERKILLYAGRIADEKNLDLLLDALGLVFNQIPQCEQWIVGDGPARQKTLVRARQLGLGDRVRFFGFLDPKTLSEIYACADLFLFPSVTETQGLVVLEAMSHGLPSIVVQGGGASEAVKQGINGLIVTNNPDALANQAIQLIKNPELLESLSKGALKTAEIYSVENMAQRVLDIYAQAIQKNPIHEKTYVI